MEFLKACVRKVRQFKHPEIEQSIIISEQSCPEIYNKVLAEFRDSPDIRIVRMQPLWSGYAVDYLMQFGDIQTEYVCGIEPDVFPINKNWLYLSIKLIEEFNFTFVGGLITVSQPEDTIYYYKNSFYWLAQYLRIGKTKDYRELALEGGFTRYHNRTTEFHNKIELDRPMTWGNDDWDKWAKQDYYARGSDDATVAHCWEDNYRENNKFSFAVTHLIGVPGEESGYGRIIDGIVFHFGFHRTSVGLEIVMGEKYRKWTERINNGFDDNLIEEMLNAAMSTSQYPNTMGGLHGTGSGAGIEGRSVWDGKLKKMLPPSEALNKRIEELKKT